MHRRARLRAWPTRTTRRRSGPPGLVKPWPARDPSSARRFPTTTPSSACRSASRPVWQRVRGLPVERPAPAGRQAAKRRVPSRRQVAAPVAAQIGAQGSPVATPGSTRRSAWNRCGCEAPRMGQERRRASQLKVRPDSRPLEKALPAAVRKRPAARALEERRQPGARASPVVPPAPAVQPV
jgi:hypothetical protein